MQELTPTDLAMVVRRIPSDVRKLMDETGLFLAGGFIREVIAGAPVNDIDLFGGSKEALDDAARKLQLARYGAGFHETQNAFTVLCPPRLPVQFICKWLYTDPEQLLLELDFTVCQAAVWKEEGKWSSMCSERFYSDLAAKRLFYTFPRREEAAGGSFMRVRKFLARGYNIQVHSLAGVTLRLMNGIKEERLTALLKEGDTIDDARFRVLKSLLHEVDPLFITDGVELREEDSPFDSD